MDGRASVNGLNDATQWIGQAYSMNRQSPFHLARQNGQASSYANASAYAQATADKPEDSVAAGRKERFKRMVMGQVSDGYPCYGPITIPTGINRASGGTKPSSTPKREGENRCRNKTQVIINFTYPYCIVKISMVQCAYLCI